MSPKQEDTRSRSETVRQRRATETAKTQYKKVSRTSVLVRNMHPDMVVKPVKTRSMGKPAKRQYQIAMGASRSRVSLPALPMLDMGWRWVSLVITAAMGFFLYGMFSSGSFFIPQAEVLGIQRLSMEEVNRSLNIYGLSIFYAEPKVIEATLREAFPEFSSVSVDVNLPNFVTVVVTEREPVIAWQQGEQTVWVDADGFSFPVRGAAEGVIPVTAAGSPPQVQAEVSVDSLSAPVAFMSATMVKTIQMLAPYVPADTTLFYDPQYGFGWNDSQGWAVYFGNETGDMTQKLTVYQGLSQYLIQNGITATMMSVEFPHHPFYRTE